MNAAASLPLTSLPAIYTIPGLSRVAIPAGVLGADGLVVPGSFGPVTFRFPQASEVTGLLVLPATGNPDTAGGVMVELLDDNNEHPFSDHVGDARVPRLPFAFPALAMNGRGFHPFPLALAVHPGMRWQVTLKNPTLAIINVASVAIFRREVR